MGQAASDRCRYERRPLFDQRNGCTAGGITEKTSGCPSTLVAGPLVVGSCSDMRAHADNRLGGAFPGVDAMACERTSHRATEMISANKRGAGKGGFAVL